VSGDEGSLGAHDEGARRSGRVAALILIGCAVIVAIAASQIEFSFSSDPIGPRAFPYVLALTLGVCGLWYFLQPGDAEPWPEPVTLMRAAALIGATCAATAAMNIIGFIPAATIMCGVAAYLFGAGPIAAVVIGVAQALFWFALFKFAFGTYLPAGTLWFPA
jgi:putative tricarboxylic transport membrane protein